MREFRLIHLLRYFFWIGATCFGGPVALVAAMQRDLIDKRKVFTQEQFQKGLTLAQMSPGPMATQLAMYFGWCMGGRGTAALAGFALVLPSFIIVVVLAMMYLEYGSLPWIERMSLALSPGVLAIVAMGAWKLGRKNLAGNWALWLIALGNAAYMASTRTLSLSLFFLSAILYLLLRQVQKRGQVLHAFAPFWLTGLHGEASVSTLKEMILFFGKAGAFVFGSGLAIVPALQGGVVNEHHWLTQRQFVDAVAVAMITPGPVVITTAFIGFLVAGFIGAMIAAISVFLPCYLLAMITFPSFEYIVKHAMVRELVNGITAAAIGAIAGGAVVIGVSSIHSWTSLALTLVCLGVLIGTRKVPDPVLLLVSGVTGYFLIGR